MTEFLLTLSDVGGLVFTFPALCGLVASFSTCLLIVMAHRRKGHLFARPEHLQSEQALHKVSVPRIGGLATVMGVALALVLGMYGPAHLAIALCMAGPILIVGLDEDIGRGASPRERLFAVGLGAAIAIPLLNMWITRTGVPLFDMAVQSQTVGVLFTLVLVAGVSHAFNIIDGLNGLCAGVALVTALGMALLALGQGDVRIAGLILLAVPALLGFLLWNFPTGHIFLGDTGAYLAGFALVWAGIALLDRHTAVSPWAVFLVFFWPIAEMLSSILRRLIRRLPVTSADMGHVHHVAYRALFPRFGRLANPLGALAVTLAASVPVALGVALAETARASHVALCFAVFAGAVLVLSRLYPGGSTARVVVPVRQDAMVFVQRQDIAP